MADSMTDQNHEALRRIWWLLLIDGILSIIIGFLALTWRSETLVVLTYFFGAWLCVIGVLALVSGAGRGSTRRPHAVAGTLTLIAGLVTLFWPHITIFVFAVILAWTLLVWGVLYIVASFASRPAPGWWLGLIGGVLLVMLSIWAIRHPGNALNVLIAIFGIAAVVYGIVELLAAFAARSASHDDGPRAAIA